LVIAANSRTCAFTFIPTGQVINHKIVVFPTDSSAALCVLQSRTHEVWARFFSSTLKDDLQYTPSECFETFPFPPEYEASDLLITCGKRYYEFRSELMVKNNEGLTKTYNRFHNPDERSADILKLRELHAQMDRAVLDAYGWTDIQPTYDFREQLDESIRFTWDDDTRDEVLARLLELNRVLAEKEAAGTAKVASSKPVVKKGGSPKKKAGAKEASLALPGVEPDET
jgi:hypothetical protein